MMIIRRSPTKRRFGQFKDARGRVVTLIDPITMHASHRLQGVDHAVIKAVLNDLEQGLARQLLWRSYVLRVLLGLSVAAAAFFVLWFMGDQNFRAAMVKIYTSKYAIWLPLVIGAFVAPLLMARRRHGGRVLQELLRHCLCPHCGYDMRKLPVDPKDGATICPECGCAWMLHDTHTRNDRVDG